MTAIHTSICVLPQDDERLHKKIGQIGGGEELKLRAKQSMISFGIVGFNESCGLGHINGI
jgi:hypothetical protein